MGPLAYDVRKIFGLLTPVTVALMQPISTIISFGQLFLPLSVNAPYCQSHLHGGALDGRGDELVLDEAPDAPVRLPDELHEGTLVVLPEAGKLPRRRVLAARQLQGHLQKMIELIVVTSSKIMGRCCITRLVCLSECNV